MALVAWSTLSHAQPLIDPRLLSFAAPSVTVLGNNAMIVNGSTITAEQSRRAEPPPSYRQEITQSRNSYVVLRPPTSDLDLDTQLEEIRRIEIGGVGSEPDVARAFKRYLQAAKGGNVRAHIEVGRLLLDLSSPNSAAEAQKHFEIASRKKLADGFAWLAWLNDSKRIRSWSHEQAVSLYRQAASLGSHWAAYKLGVIYARGVLGQNKHETRAIEWFWKAADGYYVPAMVELSWIFEYGDMRNRDPRQALDLLMSAARLGDSSALYLLGIKYSNGDGVPRDWGIANDYLLRSANLGDTRAQNELGAQLFNGFGVSKDTLSGLKWFRKSAMHGNLLATYNLGLMYENGTGVERDATIAAAWYKKASDAGDFRGRAALGEMLINGRGITKDAKRGIELLESAAALGSATAAYSLSQIYASTDAGGVNWFLTEKWLRRAVELDSPVAQNDLAALIHQGKITRRPTDDLLKLIESAANAGLPIAVVNLARRYAGGIGVVKDVDKAIKLLEARHEKSRADVVTLALARQYASRARAGDLEKAVALAAEIAANDDEASQLLAFLLNTHVHLTKQSLVDLLLPRLHAIAANSSSPQQNDAAEMLAAAILSDKWKHIDHQLTLRALLELSEREEGDSATLAWMIYMKKNNQLILSPQFSELVLKGARQNGPMSAMSRLFKDFLSLVAIKDETEGFRHLAEFIEKQKRSNDWFGPIFARVFEKGNVDSLTVVDLREMAKNDNPVARFFLCARFAEYKEIPNVADMNACR